MPSFADFFSLRAHSPFRSFAAMLILRNLILAVPFLATTLAMPLTKRAYGAEMKAVMVHIDESWKTAEAVLGAFPMANAKPNDFDVRTDPQYQTLYIRNSLYISKNVKTILDTVLDAHNQWTNAVSPFITIKPPRLLKVLP